MKVTRIAYTALNWHNLSELVADTAFGVRINTDWSDVSTDALGEFAGRACYQSWDMPNPKTATNEGYMANIISQGHYSVLEHASVTFYIEGVSRSLTHELVRHRHLSYSELSQRYVDVADTPVVTPPAMREKDWPQASLDSVAAIAAKRYEDIVNDLVADGLPRKQAREAARSVMPNAIETKIVVTGNLRAWRDFLGKRWHVAADAEIRELAGEVLRQLREVAPNSVQDIPDEPYGTEVAA